MEQIIPDNPFISPEWELPADDGVYEVCDMFGQTAVTLFDSSCGAFLPVTGIIGLKGWRKYIPDEADIAEYHLRGRDDVIWI